MAYTDTQQDALLDAHANRIQRIPTTTQIEDLTDLINIQHTALLDLVAALTARIQVLEDWRIIHMNDSTAHSGHTHD